MPYQFGGKKMQKKRIGGRKSENHSNDDRKKIDRNEDSEIAQFIEHIGL